MGRDVLRPRGGLVAAVPKAGPRREEPPSCLCPWKRRGDRHLAFGAGTFGGPGHEHPFRGISGYGRSAGKPSQKSITEAFTASYDLVASRSEVDSERIFLWGRSIGGGAVCALAAQRPSAGLILMSTFTSLRPFARRYLAPSFLIRDPFDNLEVVRRYPHPVLVIHGRNDTVIPYQHGVELARHASHARLVPYDCDHNDCRPGGNRSSGFWKTSVRTETPLHPAEKRTPP